MKKTLLILLLIFPVCIGYAQEKYTTSKDTSYIKVIQERSNKIVSALGISDNSRLIRVRDIIAQQYYDLNKIHSERDAKIKEAKQSLKNRDSLAIAIKNFENEADAKMYSLHFAFISKLMVELDADQIIKVKDGLTYGVVPITYNGYLAMLPNLTETQKAQIYAWLVEAREHAMDAESSDKKHGWFGKYKGRINNYLTSQGIDMKKASMDWEKRIKEENNTKK